MYNPVATRASSLCGQCQGSCSPPTFACLFCNAVSLKMVSKWSNEDVVEFLDVCEKSEGLMVSRVITVNNTTRSF